MSNEKRAVLKVDEIGCGSIVVDGCDLSNYVTQVIISADVGRPTRLTVVVEGVNVTADVKAKIDAIIGSKDRKEDCENAVTTIGTGESNDRYQHFTQHEK